MKRGQILFDFKEAEKEHKRMFPLATPETQLKKLNEEFDEWVRKLKYDTFISEYNTPFEKIASFGKMSLLNNSKDKKPLISENLYFHKAEGI